MYIWLIYSITVLANLCNIVQYCIVKVQIVIHDPNDKWTEGYQFFCIQLVLCATQRKGPYFQYAIYISFVTKNPECTLEALIF